jgi:DNA repair protein SbcC/Rad50
LESQGRTKADHLRTLEQQAAVIGEVPCAGHSIHATCPLLAHARSASQQAAEQRITVKDLRESYRAKRTMVDTLTPIVAQLPLKRGELRTSNVALNGARQALQTVNDLLLACYGPRFTVEIRTQRELASGDLREGFDILVHDADNGSTKPVSVMSGGQKVWINECLTRGIALYLGRNSGESYETLFSDESDGPLDPERKVQFMKMKREVLRQGGYAREFFISQTPDLVLEADAVIDVEALAA